MAIEVKYKKQEAYWEASVNGAKVLEYVYGEKDDVNPSFRLVKTLDGNTITIYRPWDHPWHPGMFFSWKYMNGLNFWEAKYHGEDNKVVTDTFTPVDDEEVGFNQSISYITQEGENILEESREVRVKEGPDGYFIHWQGTFTPTDGPVTLDRTEHTEETPWGGYAGLSCRFNRNFLNPVITTDVGEFTAEDAYGKAFKWCDYAGKVDGYVEDTWAGVCLIDHPKNLRHPSPKLTYDYKDMQFLSASFLFDEPFVLNMGETLTLNYTFYVHDGKIQQKNINQIWNTLK
ncbi:PmoA family protein [Aquibacillus koreensis]|uniref:PmoA family protein n=1 Tax=Aquibacillus koreensis TaxID=279446 RepID=A0A9X4ALB8_9BACI|nr:PmoA family protein [Aquibacillus koreensis]MCT2535455.1 PmoA family protein [Aquibacillus koreensis]MDC3422290.1 PmoA family protein [Aquibacillus koreensis]